LSHLRAFTSLSVIKGEQMTTLLKKEKEKLAFYERFV
jgi:hypothetical protein